LLVYEAHYSHRLQVEASNPASEFPLNIFRGIKQRLRQIIKELVTLHLERQRFELTGKHYAMVAEHFIDNYLKSDFSR